MRLKKAMVEEGEDLEVLSLGLERLSRAIGIEHKVSPKRGDEDHEASWERALRDIENQLFPPGTERPSLALSERRE
jgi:hypothetical protein